MRRATRPRVRLSHTQPDALLARVNGAASRTCTPTPVDNGGYLSGTRIRAGGEHFICNLRHRRRSELRHSVSGRQSYCCGRKCEVQAPSTLIQVFSRLVIALLAQSP